MADWKVGCFSRPWTEWSFDEALDGMKAAGFKQIGLLGSHQGEPFLSPESTPEYLDTLKERIVSRGLDVTFGRLPTRHDTPLPEEIAKSRKFIDQAHHLGITYLMAFASGNPAEYDHYYRLMKDAAEYAASRGIHIVFKPHGGCTDSADEMLETIARVDHPNFHLWYDAGNIIHYTDKDPMEDLERVVRHVRGFCAKDCAVKSGDVMIQFGDGKVDFAGVFRRMQAAGFNGPVMIECCAGKTVEEVTAKASENRIFLERLFASL